MAEFVDRVRAVLGLDPIPWSECDRNRKLIEERDHQALATLRHFQTQTDAYESSDARYPASRGFRILPGFICQHRKPPQ